MGTCGCGSSVVVVVAGFVVDVVVVVLIISMFVTFVPAVVTILSTLVEFAFSDASVVETLLANKVRSVSVVKGPALDGPGSGTLVKFFAAVVVTSTMETSVSLAMTLVVTLLTVGISVTSPKSVTVVLSCVPSSSTMLCVTLAFVASAVDTVEFAASPVTSSTTGFCVVMFVVSFVVVFPTTSPEPDVVTCAGWDQRQSHVRCGATDDSTLTLKWKISFQSISVSKQFVIKCFESG